MGTITSPTLGNAKVLAGKGNILVPRKGIHLTLPQTNSSHLKIRFPKRKVYTFPTIIFQLATLVLGSIIYHVFADLCFITTFGDFYQACWMLEGTSQHNFGGATNAMGSVPKTKTWRRWVERGVWDHKNIGKIWWTCLWSWRNMLLKCIYENGMGPWNQQVWIHVISSYKNQNTWIMQSRVSRHSCHQCLVANHPAGTWSSILRFHPSCPNLPARCGFWWFPWSDFSTVADQEKILRIDPRQT